MQIDNNVEKEVHTSVVDTLKELSIEERKYTNSDLFDDEPDQSKCRLIKTSLRDLKFSTFNQVVERIMSVLV